MPSDLRLLKSNAVLHLPTDEKPYYQISMTDRKGKCEIKIAVTKPFPNPIPHPQHPDYVRIKPTEYIWFRHRLGKRFNECGCASFSKNVNELFEAWQHIHLTLRYKGKDNASYAFYPEFEYELGEALAHASLVASLALGRAVPECYNDLIERFGAKVLREALEKEERGEYVEIDEDVEDPVDDFEDLTI
ncbi:hypothetical protein HD806DRAFT_459080 [Xylariaceae sp. AK1471]|nr:hypothetical protein HD806DRAFT_459080 [Xylariaceae sp. AK1471]